MSQTERILFIDRHLRRNTTITVEQTAEHFEVSSRQIKRDIEYMRDRFNAPIIYDAKNKTYKYEKSFNKLEFLDQKIIFSYVAMKSLTETSNYIPVYSEELLQNLKNEVPKDYLAVCDNISYQMPQVDNIKSDYFIDICDSIREKKCLEIDYIDSKGNKSNRIIEPEKIINYSGSWYIVSFDQTVKYFRIFNIARITNIKITKQQFIKKTPEYQNMLDEYLSSSFGIFKGKKKYTAKIRFTGRASVVIKSQSWHPKQKLITKEEYTELTLPIAEYHEILSKILSFGPDAVPLEPPELVDAWKEVITQLYDLI